MEPIVFTAAVQRITTLVDGGIRVSFDLEESAIMQAAELMACKRDGVYLEAVFTQKAADDEPGAGKSRKLKL